MDNSFRGVEGAVQEKSRPFFFSVRPVVFHLVEITLTCPSSKIFWNVPASWSAWQCVTITPAMRDGLQSQGRGVSAYGGGGRTTTHVWNKQ